MSRYEHRINGIREFPYLPQMHLIDSAGRAHRNADAVQRNRVIRRQIHQQLFRMRVGQKVLRMDFEPTATWPGGYHLRQMRKAETDARSLGRDSHWSSHPILLNVYFGVLLP